MQVSKQLTKTAHVIARVFEREADEETIDSVRAFVKVPLVDSYLASEPLVSWGYQELQRALESFDTAEDKSEWFDYLAAAYAELFLGVAEEPIAPFESVYLGTEEALYERQYFEVQEFMKACDFSKPTNFYEAEDHLAMEWAFLACMLDRSAALKELGNVDAANELDTLTAHFIVKHLALWNDAACDDFIARDDSNGFYRGFASLAKATLLELQQVIRESA